MHAVATVCFSGPVIVIEPEINDTTYLLNATLLTEIGVTLDSSFELNITDGGGSACMFINNHITILLRTIGYVSLYFSSQCGLQSSSR